MIPRLSANKAPSKAYLEFLDALRKHGFRGDTAVDFASRLAVATDNSVYQCLPEAVIFPKDSADISKTLELLCKTQFRAIRISARGGGTGTNGQSLSAGLILDLSRYMNEILEVNLQEGWAWVQPGVVLDQLNQSLSEHDLFFAPNLSPSNRATLGGMINTDASGKGSRIYGKTSDHILELELALWDGTVLQTSPLLPSQREAWLTRQSPRIQELVKTVDGVFHANQEEIKRRFLPLTRFLTGYNLPHLYREGPEGAFNLGALICGSEGTLAIVTRAKVKLSPIPRCKALFILFYPSFDDALASASWLVKRNPGAIETVDDTILARARHDLIWHRIADDLPADSSAIAAINLVEFWAESPQKLQTQVQALHRDLASPGQDRPAILGYQFTEESKKMDAWWDLRKKGVGLLAAGNDTRRPVAFVEDTVVPPENLAAYIRDFRQILDEAGLKYGMFGHVDVGCLHLRPALNLRDPEDQKRMVAISDQVMELVQRHGGVLWGEHGRGYRSQYTPDFFGSEIYAAFQRIKAAFDPHNQLNPGKLATPEGRDDALVRVDALTRGAFDREIDPEAASRWQHSIYCNGNAACLDVRPDAIMCPSSKVTRDRIHSPKGRATLMREWLRQLSQEGYAPAGQKIAQVRASWTRWFRKAGKPAASDHALDFSHEVYDAMQGCLSCKACATQCPVKVDVPRFKAEFLELYHSRYRRPWKDWLIGGMEKSSALMARFPLWSNWLLQRPALQWVTEHLFGMVDTPALAFPPLRPRLQEKKLGLYSDRELCDQAASWAPNSVVIVQDPVTSFYEPWIVEAAAEAIAALGYQPLVLSFGENGKGMHVKGMLPAFLKVARRQSERLRRLDTCGYPLIGLDPAFTLCYRDEYQQVLPPAEHPPPVQLLDEWLLTQVDSPAIERLGYKKQNESNFYLLGHCTQRAALPQSDKTWERIFSAWGLNLQALSVGCCGMCGAYGHEAVHRQESAGIFAMSWAPKLRQLAQDPKAEVLATGYSCRSQIHRLDYRRVDHPIVALLAAWRRQAPQISGPAANRQLQTPGLPAPI